MGRKKHPCGKAGTWIEVKVIKGRTYWYERTRVYLGAGKSRVTSKYLGPGRQRTPQNAAADLHESTEAHGENQSPEQKESVAHKRAKGKRCPQSPQALGSIEKSRLWTCGQRI
jgi:hypothetical protein